MRFKPLSPRIKLTGKINFYFIFIICGYIPLTLIHYDPSLGSALSPPNFQGSISMYIASLVITINLVHCYIFSVYPWFSSFLSHFFIFPSVFIPSSFRGFLPCLSYFSPVSTRGRFANPRATHLVFLTAISARNLSKEFQRTHLFFNLLHDRRELYQRLLLSSTKNSLFVQHCHICLYDVTRVVFGDSSMYSRLSSGYQLCFYSGFNIDKTLACIVSEAIMGKYRLFFHS